MNIVFVDVELGRVAIEHNGQLFVYSYDQLDINHSAERDKEEVSDEDTIHRD